MSRTHHRAAPAARGHAAGAAGLRARRPAQRRATVHLGRPRSCPARCCSALPRRAPRGAALRPERRPRPAADRVRALRRRARVRHAARPRARGEPGRVALRRRRRRSSPRWSPCRSLERLARYKYTIMLAGLVLLLLPALIGREINGAKLWLRFGGLSFQPGELAKILIVLFLAAYLAENRELLSVSTRRVARRVAARRHAPRAAAAHVGALAVRPRLRERPRLLAAVLRHLPRDDLRRPRAEPPTSSSASRCSAAGAYVAYLLFDHVRDARRHLAPPVRRRRGQGLPARAVAVRARGRRR